MGLALPGPDTSVKATQTHKAYSQLKMLSADSRRAHTHCEIRQDMKIVDSKLKKSLKMPCEIQSESAHVT